jgi:hypothetical protein
LTKTIFTGNGQIISAATTEPGTIFYRPCSHIR